MRWESLIEGANMNVSFYGSMKMRMITDENNSKIVKQKRMKWENSDHRNS